MARHQSFWMILAGAVPTAFRSPRREDLEPTLHQLQRTQANVTLRWFERGRVWDSPEAAKEANFARQRDNAARKDGWRPGGSHKDPRARYQLTRDQKRSRFKDRLIRFGPAQDRDDHAPGAPPKPEAPENAPPRTESAPPRPEGAPPRADRPPQAQWKKPWQKPHGDRPFRPRENSGAGADRRPDWRSKDRPGSSDRPKFERPKFDRPKFDRPKERYGSNDRPRFDGPKEGHGSSARPKFDRPKSDRPKERSGSSDRPKFDRPKFDRPKGDRPWTKPAGPGGRRDERGPANREGRPDRRSDNRPWNKDARPPGGSGARPPWHKGPGGSRPAWKGKPRPEGAGRFKSRPPGKYGPPKPRGPKKPR